MKIIIRRGEYLHSYEPHDIPGAFITLRYTVYDPDGRPAALTYEGPGNVVAHPTRKDRNMLVLGSAYSAYLDKYDVDKEPTAESLEYDAGYRKGFTARRAVTMAQAAHWTPDKLDGYQDGRLEGRRYRGEA